MPERYHSIAVVVMMRLGKYHFGRIEVDGVPYEQDLEILLQEVRAWRRKEGHRVYSEDLAGVLAEGPQVLIVGTGYTGLLRVTPMAERLVRDRGIELDVLRTGEAVDAYNELAPRKRVCALLHLTC